MNDLINPNDFGKKILAESCQKVEINDLVRKITSELKKELIKAEVATIGANIRLTTSNTRWGGIRYWFVCPECNKRRGALFQGPNQSRVACGECLNITYKKERYSKMIELQM